MVGLPFISPSAKPITLLRLEEERKERLKRERLWKERIVREKVDVTITVFFLSRTFCEPGFVPKTLHVLTQLIPRAAPQADGDMTGLLYQLYDPLTA